MSSVGMQFAERTLDKSASRIARASKTEVDLATELSALTTARTAHAANVAVARTASETLGTLVNLIV